MKKMETGNENINGDGRQAENAPQPQTIELPGENATAEQISAFWAKLGRPETADGYDFGLKEGEDGTFYKRIAPALHEAGITQKQLDALMPGWNKAAGEAQAEAAAKLEADNEKAIAELQAEWKGDYDKNVELAKRACAKAGVSAEEIDMLAAAKGSAWVYRTFAKIGRLAGDDAIITGGKDSGGVPGTAAEARARIKGLMGDSAFAAKIAEADPAAVKLWNSLHDVAMGGAQ